LPSRADVVGNPDALFIIIDSPKSRTEAPLARPHGTLPSGLIKKTQQLLKINSSRSESFREPDLRTRCRE
jgi:hypothetical protein